MARKAIGHRIEQDWTASLLDQLPLADHRVGDRQRIVTVHTLRVHAVRIHAQAEACEHIITHRLSRRLAAHAVEVVHDVENDR